MATTMPQSNDVDLVIADAQSEAQVLLQRRAEITRRLTAIRRTIADLVKTFGHEGASDLMTSAKPGKRNRQTGLTGVCRSVLLETPKPLTALAVVQSISTNHPELINHHKDPIASVTAILLRLESYGEAISETAGTRKRLWMSKDESRAGRSCAKPQAPTSA